jgi:alpha/beta superfamily hydrolase
MSRAIDFRGPAGRLEGLLDGSAETGSGPGAVLAHPHPLRGGTMHHTVLYRTAKVLADAGIESLRFNFRGVGASEGAHDHGEGEVLDYGAALEALTARGRSPLLAAGYSFGAVAALRSGARDPRVRAICCIGFPLTGFALTPEAAGDLFASLDKPAVVVQGEFDPLGSVKDLTRLLAGAPRARLVVVPESGHFFEGKAREVAAAVVDFARDQVVTH